MKKNLIFVLAILFVANFQTQNITAAWGDKDISFGFVGVYTDNCSSNCLPRHAALQSDGKILVTGSREISGKTRFFLRRYLANGSVDTSFGNDGFAVSNAFINVNSSYTGNSIVIQPDGKIVVAGIIYGSYRYEIAVWRFTSSGMGDSSIGNGGMRVYPKNFWGLLSLDVVYQNGKLVIGYTDNVGPGIYHGVLIRLNSNGVLDTTFGNNGENILSAGSFIKSLLIEANTDKIVFATDYNSPILTRKLPDGQDDPSFQSWNHSLGLVTGLVRLSNGKYVISLGQDIGYPATYSKRIVVKFSSDGVFEAITPEYVESLGNQFHFLGEQQNGRIVVGSPKGFYRFNSALDDHSREIYTTNNLPAMDSSVYYKSVILQPDDKMIIVTKSSTGRIMLMRVLPA